MPDANEANAFPVQSARHSRYRGCLLGGAIGDALGAPVEFMSDDAIWRRFGPEGVCDFVPAYGRLGAITDDTQMTLFTAEGLLRGQRQAQQCARAPAYGPATATAYLRWLLTQGFRSPLLKDGEDRGGLLQQRELFARRAPGNTCLTALETMARLGEPALNDSKGCGGVMRVAPVGLFMAHRLDAEDEVLQQTFALGAELAALTHGHPSGYLSAGYFAACIALLARAVPLTTAVEQVKPLLRQQSGHEETLAAVEQAQALARERPADPRALPRLGEAWVAEEALAIGLYCALSAASPESGIILAVNHGGDSDSTGSIAGNLLGLMHGAGALPERWLEGLELREVIEAMADELATGPVTIQAQLEA